MKYKEPTLGKGMRTLLYRSLCVEWVTPDEYKNAMDVNSDEGNGEDERQSIRYVDMVKEDPKV
jgi:hypothetical protein